MEQVETPTVSLTHGAESLPKVTVDSYSAELREGDRFLGDRASKSGFQQILDEWRAQRRQLENDPLGDKPTDEISKKKLDKILIGGDLEAAGLVQGAIESFAQELAAVLRRFLHLKSWRGTERVAIGGGLRSSRIGELAIGRAAILFKTDGMNVDLVPVRHHPDEAGLIGAVHLVPSWMLSGCDSILAVDIGGTKIRAGIVVTKLRKHPDLSKAAVVRALHWRYANDNPTRDDAVDRLAEMLRKLVEHAANEKVTLAPFIGVGCPGLIRADGSIERGGQNLPGNWESSRLCLPERLREGVGKIDGHKVAVVMHNDAVVQGLSELTHMNDVERWGVLTIGTGLGNARFTNRPRAEG